MRVTSALRVGILAQVLLTDEFTRLHVILLRSFVDKHLNLSNLTRIKINYCNFCVAYHHIQESSQPNANT